MSDEQITYEEPEAPEADADEADGFTKADAESAGWVFVHSQEAETSVTSSVQGETRISEAVHRAEKYVNDKLINEVADTFEKLLDQIKAYEAHLESIGHEDAGPSAVEKAMAEDENDRVVSAAEAATALQELEAGSAHVPAGLDLNPGAPEPSEKEDEDEEPAEEIEPDDAA